MKPIHDAFLGGLGWGGAQVVRQGGQLHQGGLSQAALLSLQSLLLILRHIACSVIQAGPLEPAVLRTIAKAPHSQLSVSHQACW